MNGLDLFSGIGGISLALHEWVKTVCYCETDKYCQAILLSRMSTGELDHAPIWDDVRTLTNLQLPSVDIIFGGFPCQDISCAGAGLGLVGERSGLYWLSSFFSKTSQQLELGASTLSSSHLPNYGMIVDGQLFQPKKLEPVTSERGGSCLPTATATAYGFNRTNSKNAKRRLSLESMAKRGVLPTPMGRDWKGSGGENRKSPDLAFTMGGNLHPQFVEELMGYPIGWTELEDWATQLCQHKRERHL